MGVTYSNPQKNADINKSRAALVEIIDELRTRFARKNDAWSEAQVESDRRLALLRECNDYRVRRNHSCPRCFLSPHLVCKEGLLHSFEFKDRHAAGCELAEEIK